MLTWVQGPDLNSKAVVRTRCCQKLEDMIQQLQVWEPGMWWSIMGNLCPSPEVFQRSLVGEARWDPKKPAHALCPRDSPTPSSLYISRVG